MKTYIFDIAPVSKPRMVRSDKWKERTITDSYWAFKAELKLHANIQGLRTLPAEIKEILFVVPMPDSWSEKKKIEFNDMPHTQRPDLDNFLKGLQDCLCTEDSHIWKIENMAKRWGRKGQLYITC
jgi:Holliday junction resolvase RusA-like endonuclease